MCVLLSSFPFGFKGGVWESIALVPDHCLSLKFPLPHRKSILSYMYIAVLFDSNVCKVIGEKSTAKDKLMFS